MKANLTLATLFIALSLALPLCACAFSETDDNAADNSSDSSESADATGDSLTDTNGGEISSGSASVSFQYENKTTTTMLSAAYLIDVVSVEITEGAYSSASGNSDETVFLAVNGGSLMMRNLHLPKYVGRLRGRHGLFHRDELPLTVTASGVSMFYITNIIAVITLEGNTFTQASSSDYLFVLEETNQWGTVGSNGEKAMVTLINQSVTGYTAFVGTSSSSLSFNATDSSSVSISKTTGTW